MSKPEQDFRNAIHEEAEKLLKAADDPKEVRRIASLLISLARYGHDVRASDER